MCRIFIVIFPTVWHSTCLLPDASVTQARLQNGRQVPKANCSLQETTHVSFGHPRQRFLHYTKHPEHFSTVPAGVPATWQDLQSGNLSAAQSDFASLKNLGAQNSSATSQSNSPIAQAFKQLAKDLQSGNLSAAQQDFKTIQQDFQNQSPRRARLRHRSHTIIIAADSVRSLNCSTSSAPRCRRAISPPRNRHTLR